ncbi:MAG: TlpA family protein disulfide reductase [Candidatus Rokuibacteriota bacterium]
MTVTPIGVLGRALAAAVALVGAAAALSSAGASEATRFVPWTAAPPPAVVMKRLDGGATSMADYRGKVVLVSFWASWCEFCKEQMLALQQLKERLAGEPFEILGVNFGESRSKVRDYVRALSVDFPIVLDPNQEGMRAWRVRVLPVSFVVAADGLPRYTVVGEYDWASAEAVETIRRLLP